MSELSNVYKPSANVCVKCHDRKPKIKGIEPSCELETEYLRTLYELLGMIEEDIENELMPLLKNLKETAPNETYTYDAIYKILDEDIENNPNWSTAVIAAIDTIVRKYDNPIFLDKYEQRMESIVRRQMQLTSAGVVKVMVKSGVPKERIILQTTPKIRNIFQASVYENINLIKSLPRQELKNVTSIVTEAILGGGNPTAIQEQLVHQFGVNRRRAKVIARDQLGKINSDTERARYEEQNIELFKWSTSNDRRVSGDPSGKYPKAKIKCYFISRTQTKHGKGIYTLADGATWAGETKLYPGRSHIQCRCTSIALIPGINYDPKRKLYLP